LKSEVCSELFSPQQIFGILKNRHSSPHSNAESSVFLDKKEICEEMIQLELLCEDLTYGSPKPEDKITEAIILFNKIEPKLKNGAE